MLCAIRNGKPSEDAGCLIDSVLNPSILTLSSSSRKLPLMVGLFETPEGVNERRVGRFSFFTATDSATFRLVEFTSAIDWINSGEDNMFKGRMNPTERPVLFSISSVLTMSGVTAIMWN